jgi:ribosomal protein L7/L12
LEQLKKPDAEKRFAERLKQIETSASVSRRSTRSYPIEIPLPLDYTQVESKTPLKVGTRCQACWARKWNAVTVVRLLDTGDVEIQWDGWSSVDVLSRDSLIIANSILKELGSPVASTAPATTDSPSASVNAKEFKLVLQDNGKNKALVIRGVMKLTELDLKSVAGLIEELPLDLASNLSKEVAEDWKSKFERAGAKVTVEPVTEEPEK